MILTGIVVGFSVFFAVLLTLWCAYHVLKRRITNVFIQNFTSADADTASPFALVIQSVASVFGAEIAQHLKAVFLGLQSVEAKNERRDQAEEIIGKSSVLRAMLTSFPALGKKMKKNPEMAQIAESILDKALNKQEAPGGGNHNQSPYRF